MTAIADPAAVCAALAPLLLDERRTRIDEAAASRLGGLRLVIENLHDPHNGAAVLRSAEAFGVQRVDVIESVEPFRFSSTVTQGCEKWLDVVRHATLRFEIPMAGMTRSLNLSVAAALIAERAAALRAPGDLPPAAQLALRARFYAASVRGADAVVARYRGLQ
jgi:tRNA (guanosine-2'-O-)-methyltransferase